MGKNVAMQDRKEKHLSQACVDIIDQATDSDGMVYYFAYGSNMGKISLNRRKVTPQKGVPGILKNMRLHMNVAGIPFVEPSFANVEPAEGCEVHGMLWYIPKSQMIRIVQTEGGGGYFKAGYWVFIHEAETYDG